MIEVLGGELLVALVLAAFVTYLWRGLGVALSGKLNVKSAIFEWVACVAYALLAGLIARMIFLPSGPLAETALPDRVAAAALAFTLFFLTRKNLLIGVSSGFALLVLLTLGRGWAG
jgi:branched-subunit amino acid transport protein